MQSRRDQVQAYFFVVGRLVAAVSHGRPDALMPPNRRTATGTVLGILLAAVMVGVFGLLGLIVPGGSTSWQVPGAIVVASDTGARYVYLSGQLRPVLNYASARLASGNDNPPVSVRAASLTGAPVGQPIGIPGAPDGVPAAAALDSGPWSVCVGAGGSAAGGPLVSVLFGRLPGEALDPDQAMLVATPDGTRYLIWQGSRHRLPDPTVLTVLGYGRTAPVLVTVAWLNPIPAGRDVAVPPTVGAGLSGPDIGGRPSLIGQVFEQRDVSLGTDQFYLLRTDGLAPLSRTGAALVLAYPTTAAAYPGGVPAPIPISAPVAAALPTSRGGDLAAGLPALPPHPVVPPSGAVPCVRYTSSGQRPPTAVPEVRPTSDITGLAAPVARHPVGVTADLVSAPATSGVLARSSPAAATYLITDTGTRFPLLGENVMPLLGYSPTSVVTVSQQMLDLLPAGPPLSTAGALADAS